MTTSTVYLVASYIALSAFELYMFLMQRSALEIGRERGLDQRTSRYMLPLWYIMTYPVRIGRWVTLFFIFRAYGLGVAIAFAAVPFTLSLITPVPHKHFIPAFKRKVLADIADGSDGPGAQLMVALLSTAKGQ